MKAFFQEKSELFLLGLKIGVLYPPVQRAVVAGTPRTFTNYSYAAWCYRGSRWRWWSWGGAGGTIPVSLCPIQNPPYQLLCLLLFLVSTGNRAQISARYRWTTFLTRRSACAFGSVQRIIALDVLLLAFEQRFRKFEITITNYITYIFIKFRRQASILKSIP